MNTDQLTELAQRFQFSFAVRDADLPDDLLLNMIEVKQQLDYLDVIPGTVGVKLGANEQAENDGLNFKYKLSRVSTWKVT